MKKRHLVSLVTIIKDNLYAYRKADWESKDVVETVSELITKKFAKYMKDQEGLEKMGKTEEDFLGAGAIIHAGLSESGRDHLLDSKSKKASSEFFRIVNGSNDTQSQLVASFRQSLGGRNLIELGMDFTDDGENSGFIDSDFMREAMACRRAGTVSYTHLRAHET